MQLLRNGSTLWRVVVVGGRCGCMAENEVGEWFGRCGFELCRVCGE